MLSRQKETITDPVRITREEFTIVDRCGIPKVLATSIFSCSTRMHCPFYTDCTYNAQNRIHDCGGVWICDGLPCIEIWNRVKQGS